MFENRMDLKYISANTRKVFERLASHNFISKYTLVGETALSLQIGHRLSVDLDFIFDGNELNMRTIKRIIASVFPEHRIIRQE